IGTVLKNDVNKRFTEHRFAPDKFHFRRGDKDRGNRICDLVFNQVGRVTLPIGVNDDLHVAQVWNRVERRVEQSINTGGDCENREDEDEELVPRTCGDDTLDQCIAWRRLTGVRVYHGLTGDSLGEGEGSNSLSACCTFDSASINKFALATTCSPSRKPLCTS